MHDIMRPVVEGMARDGVPFSGFLYAVGGRNASGWYLGTVEAYDLV